MLKAGSVLLTVWAALEIVVAGWVTLLTVMGRSPPALALTLTEAEIGRITPQTMAVINAQAMIANPCIIVIGCIATTLVWRCVLRGLRWAYWLLVATLVPLQGFAFVSDGFLGHHDLVANLASTVLVVGSLALCGFGLRTYPPPETAGV